MHTRLLIIVAVAIFLIPVSVAVLEVWPIPGSRKQAPATQALPSGSEALRFTASGSASNFASASTRQTAAATWVDRQQQQAGTSRVPGKAATTPPDLLQALPGLPVEIQEQIAHELGGGADFRVF